MFYVTVSCKFCWLMLFLNACYDVFFLFFLYVCVVCTLYMYCCLWRNNKRIMCRNCKQNCAQFLLQSTQSEPSRCHTTERPIPSLRIVSLNETRKSTTSSHGPITRPLYHQIGFVFSMKHNRSWFIGTGASSSCHSRRYRWNDGLRDAETECIRVYNMHRKNADIVGGLCFLTIWASYQSSLSQPHIALDRTKATQHDVLQPLRQQKCHLLRKTNTGKLAPYSRL